MEKGKMLAQLPIKGPDGEEMIIYVLHEFEVGGDKYILYVEDTESEEVIPAKLKLVNDEDFELAPVEDDEMFKVESEFERFLDELEEEDEEDFDETGDYEEKFAVELDDEEEEEE